MYKFFYWILALFCVVRSAQAILPGDQPLSPAPAKPISLNVERARELGEAFQLGPLLDVVSDHAHDLLAKTAGEKMATWAVAHLEQSAKQAGLQVLQGKLNVGDLFKKNPALGQELKLSLRKNFKEYLPQVVRTVLYEKLMQGVLSEDERKYFAQIEKEVITRLHTSLNAQTDSLLENAYDRLVSGWVQQWNDGLAPL